jgi:hypothetical protein
MPVQQPATTLREISKTEFLPPCQLENGYWDININVNDNTFPTTAYMHALTSEIDPKRGVMRFLTSSL